MLKPRCACTTCSSKDFSDWAHDGDPVRERAIEARAPPRPFPSYFLPQNHSHTSSSFPTLIWQHLWSLSLRCGAERRLSWRWKASSCAGELELEERTQHKRGSKQCLNFVTKGFSSEYLLTLTDPDLKLRVQISRFLCDGFASA